MKNLSLFSLLKTLRRKSFVFVLLSLFFSINALALVTEVGVNYSRKKNSFNSDNYSDSESVTGSLSFYFMERLALELSYTDAIGVKREKISSGSNTIDLISTQTTRVYGCDLIWIFADKKEFFQPFIKGGAARLERSTKIRDNSNNLTYSLEPDVATVPSYGAGFKIALTGSFGIKFSYDAWKTPLGGGSYSNDDSLRVGVNWLF